jgi:hypothetical protein
MKKELKRHISMAVGILAVAVIVLTQSFYQPTHITQKKNTNTEQQGATSETFVSAPSDVTHPGSSATVQEHSPSSLIEEIAPSSKSEKILPAVRKTTIQFFNTLFRVFISPNAP